MKKLLLLLSFASLFSCEPAVAQDTLAYRVHLLEVKQYNAGVDMIRFHDQFKGSLYMMAAGAALIGVGGIIHNNGGDGNIKAAHKFTFFGGVALLSGVVINIDSFTFIRLAGIDLK